MIAAPTAISLDDFAAEVLALHNAPFKARATREKLQGVLGQVMALPGVKLIADLTPEKVRLYARTMWRNGRSRETIKSNLRALRGACDYAVRRGYLPANPVEPEARYISASSDSSQPAAAVRQLGRDDVVRFLTHLLARSGEWEGHRQFALGSTVVYAGLRRKEALLLRWDDCDFEAGKLRVMNCALARRWRHMPAKLVEILKAWRPFCPSPYVFPGVRFDGAWTGGCRGSRADQRIKAAGKAVGIEGLNFELLRRFWSSELERVSLPEFETLAPPNRDQCQPEPVRHGKRPKGEPASLPPVLDMSGGREQVRSRGLPIGRPLSAREFNILSAMIAAGCPGGVRLSAEQLHQLSGHADPVRTLRELAKLRPLETVILFPRKGYRGGYGLAAGRFS